MKPAVAEPADQPDLEGIVRKIQKLMARAESGRGASEEEAATATRMVQELMTKYNLDMADIAAASGANDAVRVKEHAAKNTRYKWQRDLARYTAEANFCYYMATVERVKDADGEYVYERVAYGGVKVKRRTLHTFVGRKANVITAQLMYEYLTHALDEMVPIAGNHERFSRFALSWKEGAADRLCERLSKRKQDLVAEHDKRAKAANAAAEAAAAKAEKLRLAAYEATAKERAAKLAGGAYDATGMAGPGIPQDRPASADAAWRPGDGAQAAEELPPPVVAMVLASVYDVTEQEANYELAHDMDPGTLAKWRRENEESRREQEAAAEEEVREEVAAATRAPETERQQRKREREERKEAERARRRRDRENETYWRQQERADAKRDHSAYSAGAAAAKKIGLDPQVKASNGAPRLAGK